jgi:MFS family permease
MSPQELRASLSLASIFGLRLFGMFIILPVFTLHAEQLPGWNHTLIGLALGAYGLTQAALQVPFGWASDRVGRKPMLYAGLAIFAAGSFLCAWAATPALVILGRVLQGAGAISGVAIAMAADLTRESQRSKAMALIGSTIGLVFALSLVAAPFLQARIGVPGIFALTGVLAIAAMGVVALILPEPAQPVVRASASFARVLRDAQLARFYAGIFVLQAILMALFVVVPGALVRSGLAAADHWWLYLAVITAGLVIMLPVFLNRSPTRSERPVFLACIVLVAVSIAVLAASPANLATTALGLVIFFSAFNVLEAKLPALVSRAAPLTGKGTASGVYSSVQYLGTFAGAVAGGALSEHAGYHGVMAFCLVLAVAWAFIARGMGDFAAANAEGDDPVPSTLVPATPPASRS